MAVETLTPSKVGMFRMSAKMAIVRAEGSMSLSGTLSKSVVVMPGMCTDEPGRVTGNAADPSCLQPEGPAADAYFFAEACSAAARTMARATTETHSGHCSPVLVVKG
jgi:hypothetical protein